MSSRSPARRSLADVPDLPGDNALPRWLAEVAGYDVDDLRRRWRLAIDIDGPLELALLGLRAAPGAIEASGGADLRVVMDRFAAIRRVAADRRAELVVAGRTSVETLAWLGRHVPARIRAIVEERGLRASSRVAMARMTPRCRRGARPPARPTARLGSWAWSSTATGRRPRDLLAGSARRRSSTRACCSPTGSGPDERAWPGAEDRFASDLLLPDRVRDPWLRALTASAVDARIPILLGGHSLVGPGVRLLLGHRSIGRPQWS